MTEQQLISALQEGQREALRQIFDKHYENLVQRLYRLVPDQSTAEDLVQEVFVKLWEKRADLEIRQSLGGYLYRMAMNQGLSYLRKQKSRKDSFPGAVPEKSSDRGAEEELKKAELQQKIQAALATLPPRCREVFVLSRYEELSYRAIAEKLEISIKTVENHLSKALKTMREHLQDYLPLLFLLGFSHFF